MPHDAVPSQIHNSNYPPQHQADFSTEPAVSHVLGNEKLDLGGQKAYIWILFSLSLVLSSSLFCPRISRATKRLSTQKGIPEQNWFTHTYQRDVAPHRHHAGCCSISRRHSPVLDRPIRPLTGDLGSTNGFMWMGVELTKQSSTGRNQAGANQRSN